MIGTLRRHINLKLIVTALSVRVRWGSGWGREAIGKGRGCVGGGRGRGEDLCGG